MESWLRYIGPESNINWYLEVLSTILNLLLKKKISDLKSVRVELLTMAKVRCVNLL